MNNDSNRNLPAPGESLLANAIAVNTLRKMAIAKAEPVDDAPQSTSAPSTPRGLTTEMIAKVRSLIEVEVEEAKKRGVSQRALANQLRISQPALNRFLVQGAGLGLDFALALRAYFISTGRPQTLDDILGLPVAAPDARDPLQKAYDDLLAKYANLESMVHMLRTKSAVSVAEKTAALDAVGKAKRAVAGNAHNHSRKKKAG